MEGFNLALLSGLLLSIFLKFPCILMNLIVWIESILTFSLEQCQNVMTLSGRVTVSANIAVV